MEIKKSAKSDLNKRSGLFFAIGLAATLLVVWAAMEHKTYDKQDFSEIIGDILEDDEEEVPITEMLNTPPPPPPPPPPPAPEIIEVVEDEEEIEETVIESTETDEEEVIEEVEEVEVVEEIEEEEEILDIPFSVIEDKPIFPGCEGVAKSQRAKCFQEKVMKHIKKNFRNPEAAAEMGIQGRVHVKFKITEHGNIVIEGLRGPDKMLEKEARRIIEKLPKVTPGKQRGKAVRTNYTVPITFRLQ